MKVAQSCPTLCDPMNYTVHRVFQARILEWVVFSFSRGSSQPRDRTQVSCIQADSLPAEPQGKPKYTGVGSLSLLQGTFQIQELNQGLLHCRRIFYKLSHEYLLVRRKFGHRGSLSISLVFCRIILAAGWYCNLNSHPRANVLRPLEDTVAKQWHKRIFSDFSLELGD